MKPVLTSIGLLAAILLIHRLSIAQSTSNQINTKNKESKMSVVQKNKEMIRQLYEESLNKKNMGLLREYIGEEFVGIQGTKGVAAFEQPVGALIKAFPDIHWKIEELIGEDDKVYVQWKWQGTHTGQFQHHVATGKSITNVGSAVYRFREGKIISSQIQTDRLGFLQELGVLPLDLTLLSNKKPAAANQ